MMYLIDTNVISEIRKKTKANPGVRKFFKQAIEQESKLYISAITVGELQRGVQLIRHRGDQKQAALLDGWLSAILTEYAEQILDFTAIEAQVWGALRVPHHENAIDKQIAATALTHGLTLVTRNESDFAGTGINVLNPFE